MLVGVLLGGLMGLWFWFRVAACASHVFDAPDGAGRWAIIAVHVALIVVGLGTCGVSPPDRLTRPVADQPAPAASGSRPKMRIRLVTATQTGKTRTMYSETKTTSSSTSAVGSRAGRTSVAGRPSGARWSRRPG